MQGVVSVAEYLSRPLGRYVCGPTFLVWWRSRELNGIVFWGRPEEEHVQRIARALEAELSPGVVPHASLIDARRVQAVDLGAFNTLSQYVRSRREPFGRIVRRQALLRPDGLAGAAIAGFYAVLAPSYPVEVFTDSAAALEWLGATGDADVVVELDNIVSAAIGGSPTITSLRTYLDEALGKASLADAARALQLSPRQLQRKLHEVHTSFYTEQNAAQARVAKMLMLDSNYDIKRVACEVGCASVANFSALFRKVVGESPSEWRARHDPARTSGRRPG